MKIEIISNKKQLLCNCKWFKKKKDKLLTLFLKGEKSLFFSNVKNRFHSTILSILEEKHYTKRVLFYRKGSMTMEGTLLMLFIYFKENYVMKFFFFMR
jgi:hypothetical protein